MVAGRRACQHAHLLHGVVDNSVTSPSKHHAQQLMYSVPPQETVKNWTQTRWAETWASTTTTLRKFMPTPSNSPDEPWIRLYTGYGLGLVDLEQICCVGDCLRATVVIVVPNKRQTTSHQWTLSLVPLRAATPRCQDKHTFSAMFLSVVWSSFRVLLDVVCPYFLGPPLLLFPCTCIDLVSIFLVVLSPPPPPSLARGHAISAVSGFEKG